MFLFDHLKEGSFRTAYADTDSMCLGLTKTRPLRPNMTREEEYRAIFDPIVKDEMRESWENMRCKKIFPPKDRRNLRNM